MAKPQITCHICEETFKSETPPEVCPKCGANLADPQQETVIKQTRCQYSSSKNFPGDLGNLYLTDKRLLWVNTATAASYGGGLIGALAANYQKWGFSVPLPDIQTFEDSKFGLLVKAFTITTNDGSIIKLSAKPKDEWIDAITMAKGHFRNQ